MRQKSYKRTAILLAAMLALVMTMAGCGRDRSALSRPNEPQFYQVITKSGLNLRQGPSVQTKRLLTLPYKTVGKIRGRTQKLELIQGKRGFWIQTEYSGQAGQIFSGFV